MGLETATYVKDLVPANPPATDLVAQGDDHLRLIKQVLQNTFPSLTGPTLPTSTGTANAQAVTHLFAPTSYQAGQEVAFIAGFTNTGAMTLNVNGVGAANLFVGGAPAVAGAVAVGALVFAIYDGTQFQTIAASLGVFLPLTGGTLTGSLVINQGAGTAALALDGTVAAASRVIAGRTSGSNRWAIYPGNATAESGSNVGSDFVINRFSDAGALIDSPLMINRASGAATFAAQAIFSNSVILDEAVATGNRAVIGRTSGSTRWQMIFGNTIAEGGGNSGSNWGLNSFTDAGAFLGSPMAIVRSTGVCTFSAAIVNGPSDRSLKENITPLEDSLAKVQALQGVSFNFIKDKDKRQIGLVAQDVAPVVPEVMQDFIQPDEEPKLAIDYTRLVPLLIEAIKELTARVAVLEAKGV